jgi:hypothetical protein
MASLPGIHEWLPTLELHGIEIGDGRLDVKIERTADETRIVQVKHPSLDIVIGAPPAPLWGTPLDVRSS